MTGNFYAVNSLITMYIVLDSDSRMLDIFSCNSVWCFGKTCSFSDAYLITPVALNHEIKSRSRKCHALPVWQKKNTMEHKD